MRKLFLFILSITLLVSLTELHQLIQLPYLLQHYKDHKSKDPLLTFSDFLQLHYGNNHPNDKDDAKDEQLPFKSTGSINHTDPGFNSRYHPPAKTISLARTYYPTLLTIGKPFHRSKDVFHPPCS
ncbi:MAG TPA: hypothetical protein VFX58_07550 [Chitinophagaceae bacterium]|nr:hypothetical protein [Chitinophagaceae bacterium]